MIWQYAASIAVVTFVTSLIMNNYNPFGYYSQNTRWRVWEGVAGFTGIVFFVSSVAAAVDYIWWVA